MSKQNKKQRWYIALHLQSLYTLKSGDTFSQGEWFFNVNGARFPNKGHFKLGKNESLNPPDPKPTLWSKMCFRKEDPVKITIKVKEEDILIDDTMCEGEINVFFEEKEKDFEFKSKDGKVTLVVRLIVKRNDAW